MATTVTPRFRQIARSAGLPEIGVQGLRHTAATWLIAQGVSPKVVQQRLGHAHVSITLGIYSHVTRRTTERRSRPSVVRSPETVDDQSG